MESRGRMWQQFLGGSQAENPEVYKMASPLHHLNKSDPPVWFISGENDDPSTHADTFREQMKQLGIESGLTLIKNAPHGFIGKQAFFDPMIEQADAFLRETLK